ncbi:MAG: ATP-binding protein, partial [Desulfobacterales bacterium]
VAADPLDDALKRAGLQRKGLGWKPRGWWQRFPRGVTHKLDHFDDLFQEPLATVPFTRVMGRATRDLLGRQGLEKKAERGRLEARLHQSQKMETVGMLAGGVAHDLNNILSGIVSYPELILMDLPEESALRKPILTMQKAGEKAAAIVQDLLTMARRGVTVGEVVDLNAIVSEYLKSPECEKMKSFNPGVRIETDFESRLLKILGSPVHLSKMVMNLISNAAEAMPDGGKLRITTENRYLERPKKEYDHLEAGDYISLTVSDEGIGISKGDQERIFEPFYTKKVMGRSGTGLGMAVVWGTVKDHKGDVDIESAEGKGTTFTLYFPVTREEAATDKSLLSIEDYRGKGETILVIDDVEEQREIASGMLKKLGYSVEAVSSGEEAVSYMKNHTADLLVLDMIMDPGMDGLETYQRILNLRPGQKAVIASGFSATDRVKEAMKLGAGAYIKKPYLIEKIGVAVRNELEK